MPLHVSSTCAQHQEVKIALQVLSQPMQEKATYRCDDTRGYVMQFWPPDDEHMCSKHVEAWNKLIVKQKCCASSWLITEINLLSCLLTIFFEVDAGWSLPYAAVRGTHSLTASVGTWVWLRSTVSLNYLTAKYSLTVRCLRNCYTFNLMTWSRTERRLRKSVV